MNATERFVASILESSQHSLKVASLKLGDNLKVESLKELFSDSINDEVDLDEALKSLEESTEFDKVFSSIKDVLDGIEGIDEDTSGKALDLLVKGISLAAQNIEESQSTLIANAVEEAKEEIEKTVSEKYETATVEWAEAKEAELKESVISESDLETLKKAGKFVLQIEKAFVDHEISFDDSIKGRIEELETQLKESKAENTKLVENKTKTLKVDVFNSVFEGSSELEKNKLQTLSESVVFINEEDYKEKLENIKTAFGKTEKSLNEEKVEEAVVEPTKKESGVVDASELSRFMR